VQKQRHRFTQRHRQRCELFLEQAREGYTICVVCVRDINAHTRRNRHKIRRGDTDIHVVVCVVERHEHARAETETTTDTETETES